MTKKFYSTMMRFCFSERDPENIDVESDEKTVSKGKKNKESNFYVPIEHKDDVEKMKVKKNLKPMSKISYTIYNFNSLLNYHLGKS